MDTIEFMSYNNEYKIKIHKQKKIYSTNPYTQYECNISFINTLDQPVLVLKCSEKEFMSAIGSLNSFNMNMGYVMSDDIYFTSDYDNPCFIYVSALEYQTDSPVEEEMLQFSIYEVNKEKGNTFRLYMEMSYYYLEEFIFNMYQIIDDIPYIKELMNYDLLQYMEYDNLKKEI